LTFGQTLQNRHGDTNKRWVRQLAHQSGPTQPTLAWSSRAHTYKSYDQAGAYRERINTSSLTTEFAAGTLSLPFWKRWWMHIFCHWHHGCWWEWKLCWGGAPGPQLSLACKGWTSPSLKLRGAMHDTRKVLVGKRLFLEPLINWVYLSCSTGFKCSPICCVWKPYTMRFLIWTSNFFHGGQSESWGRYYLGPFLGSAVDGPNKTFLLDGGWRA